MPLEPWPAYAFSGAIAILILVILGVIAGSKRETRRPDRFQATMEVVLDGLRGVFSDALGPGGQQYLPLVLTLFLYILVCNLLGLVPGLHSATASTSVTIGLGLFVFVFVQYVGIKHNGLIGYLRHFLGPVLFLAPLLLVIEIIGELAKPFSLGMRLFGNIFGEEYINDLLAGAGNHALHLPLQIPVYALQIFTGVIQAFIFAMLTCAYVSAFTAHHHEEEEPHRNELELPA